MAIDESKIVAAYRSGRSMQSIATEIGVPVSTVHYRLRKLGVELRPAPKDLPEEVPDPEFDRLVVALYQGGAKAVDISAVAGISPTAVYKILRRMEAVQPPRREWEHPTDDPARDRHIATSYESGRTINEIGAEYSMEPRTVSSILAKMGVRTRARDGTPRLTPEDRKARADEIVRLYRSGLSSHEVGRRVGTHFTNVLRILRARGEPVRGKDGRGAKRS